MELSVAIVIAIAAFIRISFLLLACMEVYIVSESDKEKQELHMFSVEGLFLGLVIPEPTLFIIMIMFLPEILKKFKIIPLTIGKGVYTTFRIVAPSAFDDYEEEEKEEK